MTEQTTALIFGNQLTLDHPALQAVDGTRPRVLMIESQARLRSRPYHKQKLILILSAMRHFAAALAERGYQVDYREAPTVAAGIRAHLETFRPAGLLAMQPAEYPARQALVETFVRLNARHAPDEGQSFARLLPDTMFLCSADAFAGWAQGRRSLVMESFYRWQRRRLNILMDGDEPEGGRWNYDAQNRQGPPRGGLQGPPLPAAAPDEITGTVIDLVARAYADNFGLAEPFIFPVTQQAAAAWLDDFVRRRLPEFGPYEDAMVAGEPFLFHSVLSPLLNIGLLSPQQMVARALQAYAEGEAPLQSVEGFVRQVIGWREFIHGVYWLKMPDYAASNFFDARRPLPAFFWDGETAMRCLADVIDVLARHAYTHHIPRLMLVSNFATLAGLEPQAVLDWFQSLYIDAYDWVMVPNVLGLGMYADGGLLATKPYVASAAYINRMSHGYCPACQFAHTKRSSPDACPFNYLYWDFIAREADRFANNPRMALVLRNLERQDPDEVAAMRAAADAFLLKI